MCEQCQCHNCPNRKVTADYNCHDHCPVYLGYRKALDERNEERRRRNNSYVPLIGQYRR